MFLSLLDLMRRQGDLLGNLSHAAAPQIQVTDQGDALQVTVQLTGYDPRTVQIQLSETAIAIGGQATREETTEGPDFYQAQSSRSSFFRSFPLSARINPRQASSQWQSESTLVITLPKL